MAEDDLSRGILGIHIIWQLTQDRSGGLKKRLDDQLHFMADAMHGFNAEIARYLREDLGCHQLINAGNWRTADAIRLNDAERWSYTANEVLAVNTYYSPVHIGPDRGWRIDKGDQFEDVSVLLDPRAFPLNIKQVAGYPMMITETHWVPPLSYQSEAPFLAAAYQSLTGVDVVYWFATGEAEWSNQDRAEWDSASRAKWTIATPTMLGQFPAAALLFRRGDVTTGRPAVVEHRSLQQIWERVPPIIAEDPGYDPNRDLGDSARRSHLARGVDPLAFLVGPVEVVYGSDPAKTRVADLARSIDKRARVVRSDTGQLSWDYGRGLCTVNAPAAQGRDRLPEACRRGAARRRHDPLGQRLRDDPRGLARRPTAGAERPHPDPGRHPRRPTGWTDHEATFKTDGGKQTIHGRQIDSTGTMPWAVARTRATVQVRNPRLGKAITLDVNGNARGTAPVRRTGGALDVAAPGGCTLHGPPGPLTSAAFAKGSHGIETHMLPPPGCCFTRGDRVDRSGDRAAGVRGRHARRPHGRGLRGRLESRRQDADDRRLRQHGPPLGRGDAQGDPQVRGAHEDRHRGGHLARRQADPFGSQRQHREALGLPGARCRGKGEAQGQGKSQGEVEAAAAGAARRSRATRARSTALPGGPTAS